jgi:hypothetical protein
LIKLFQGISIGTRPAIAKPSNRFSRRPVKLVAILSADNRAGNRQSSSANIRLEKEMEQDPTWRPWNFQLHDPHHRIFIDADEDAMADHISANWLLPGCLFTDATFIEIAIAAFFEKHKDTELAWTSSAPPGLFLVSNTKIFFFSRSACEVSLVGDGG